MSNSSKRLFNYLATALVVGIALAVAVLNQLDD
jgi:hypothetical protein